MSGRGDGAASTSKLEASSGGSGVGRYEVFATLGRGGMAEVFLAVARGPQGFNKLVVLKRLRPHLAEEAAFREMFLDEARLAARLSHPNVVQSYEVGEGHGSYFIAMEYLDGQPLNRVIDELRTRGQRIDPVLAARIIADACSGLAHAHELRDYDGTPLRIIHRDVSPHNIFVNYDGQVKLVDFGIAKAAVSRAETEVGVLKGKIAYMAPEQATGGAIDSRADLFAMGIVLWELVAGRQLFGGDNAANTLQKLMNQPIPRPSSVAEVDPKLEAIVMRALDKDPAERFQTARDLRGALEGWLRDAGRTVRGEDVGALVTSVFEGVRAQVQGEIQKFMAGLGTESGKARTLSLASIDRMEGMGADLGGRALIDLGPQATGVASGLSRKIGAMPTASMAPNRKRTGLVVGGVVGALAIAALVLGMRARRPAEEAPVSVASVASPEPVAPPPAASSPPPPRAAAPSPSPPSPTPTPTPATPLAATPARSQSLTHHAHAFREPRPTPTPAAAPAAAAAAADSGFLTFDTYPWTRVSEGGRVLGTTPLVHVALAPGAHVLTLDNPDMGIHQTYTATIASGATLARSLGLR